MALQKISPNTTVRIYANISETDNGNLSDPSALQITITEPDGTILTYVYGTDAEITKLATGTYYAEYTVTQLGVYKYVWQTSGTFTTSFSGNLLSRM
jgi:hypothetical protein